MIKKNSKIPCEVSKTIYTERSNQSCIEVNVTQGESSDPDLVAKIATGKLKLPAGLPKGTPIDVTYSYDKDQRMSCVIKHRESRKKLVINYDVAAGTSTAETVEDKQAKSGDFTIMSGASSLETSGDNGAKLEDFLVE